MHTWGSALHQKFRIQATMLLKQDVNESSLFIHPTNKAELVKLIEQLPNKSSSGYNNKSSMLLIAMKDEILEPLELLFNGSIQQGTCPDKMKLAEVIPLYKSRSGKDITKYRPISLLLSILELLKKVVYVRIYKFLMKTGQLFHSQYGFRSQHVCEHAVVKLLSKIVKTYNWANIP